MTEKEKLYKLFWEYKRFFFRARPMQATHYGFHLYDDLLGDFSKEGIEEYLEGETKFLSAFRKEIGPSRLKPIDRIDYQALCQDLWAGLELEKRERDWETDPASYVSRCTDACYLLSIGVFAPREERLRNLALRMRKIPHYLKQAQRNLKVCPRDSILTAYEITESSITFFKDLALHQSALPASLRKDLSESQKETLKALQAYGEFLKRTLLPKAKGSSAVGRELFDFMLREVHLLPYNAKTLLEMGQEELEKAKKKIRMVARLIDPRQDWRAILYKSHLDLPHPKKLVQEYQKVLGKVKRFIEEKGIAQIPAKDKLLLTETPIYERPIIPYAAYLPPAPLEKDPRGIFYVTPPFGSTRKIQALLREHSVQEVRLTVIHEAYPGHHLQFVWQNAHPSPIRKFLQDDVLAEGWAFYCEEMMLEEGFDPDSKTYLLLMKNHLWRASRVILDSQLHTGRMTSAEGVAFLKREVSMAHDSAVREIRRYLLEPTQPSSYMIGKQEILKLREEYRRRRHFRLGEFHTRLLKEGSLPFPFLRRLILEE
ncbi:MAG: DUF885 domain-containing protein [Candidatus Omnitrophica bacterium]|nr:DUF885 domain-containing protein [Candidatus Omnitrophota bacterium]